MSEDRSVTEDDGDLDYIATEMIHGREPLSTYLRNGEAWTRRSTTTSRFNQRHPLGAWPVPAHGRHPPAILLPVGWQPYLFLEATEEQQR